MAETMIGWQHANDGPEWVPYINTVEVRYGIPVNLLARMAFEESSFLPEVISGEEVSSANCVGIMQLNPLYFPKAGQSPTADIASASSLMVSLHDRFADWQIAVAAYNWGGGSVHHEIDVLGTAVLSDMPEETQRYVRDIIADVPIAGKLIPITTVGSVTTEAA